MAFCPEDIKIPRYAMAGVPARAFVISNSERMNLGCDRQWFFRYGMRLKPTTEVRALRYGSAWAEVQEDIYRWWMVHDSAYPYDKVLRDGPTTEIPKGSCPWCNGGRVINQESGAEVDCSYCEGNDLSRPFLILAQWRQDEAEGRMEPGDAETEAATLWAAMIGYRVTYGASPPDEYRVAAVELEVAAPIRKPDGSVFRSRVPIVEEAECYRVARPGEEPSFWAVLPWYQVGKLDVVLQHRATGMLWVQDAKSSRDPSGYLRNITVDPQTTGYVWMLEEAISQGLVPFSGKVGGVQFDVASSTTQREPARLVDKPVSKTQISSEEKEIDADLTQRPEVQAKLAEAVAAGMKKADQKDLLESLLGSGEIGAERARRYGEIIQWKPPTLSKATNVTTPSWLYRRALENAEPTPDGQTPDPTEYLEHIQMLQETVDIKLYQREPLAVSPSAIREYQMELYGVALNISTKIRGMPEATPEGLPVVFPRTPLCRKPGGSCPFTALCSGSTGPEVMDDFVVLDGLTWAKTE